MIVHSTYFFIVLLIAAYMPLNAQKQQLNYWKELEDVTFRNKIDNASGFQIKYPVFGENVNKLNGKEITLKGFIVPLDELTGKNRFVLSSLPFNICFFCGGAGPETVIEVYSKTAIDFTNDAIWIKGVFEPNPNNPEKLMYLLKEAVLIKE
ncbi:MAG: hypothetical protein AAGI07_18630 [Bacteroidota bacterium]